MNLFTEIMEIDGAISKLAEEKKQQQLFQLTKGEKIGVCEAMSLEENKEKITPFAPGFGPWGW